MTASRMRIRRGPDKVRLLSLGAAAILLLLLSAGCGARRPPRFHGLDDDSWRLAFRDRWEKTSTVRAEARVNVSDGQTSYPGKMILALKKPGMARADFLDPFGRIKGLVIMSRGKAVQYLPVQKRKNDAPAGVSLINTLTGKKGIAAVEELFSMVTGLPGGFSSSSIYRWAHQGEGMTGEKISGDDVVVTMSRYGDAPIVHKVTSRRDPGGLMVIEYGKYSWYGDIPLPEKVSVTFPEQGWLLEINYRVIELNVDLEDELFSTDISRRS